MVRTGSERFGRVEPLQTHVKLHHRSGSLPCAMVRAGLRRFGRVEPPRTHEKLSGSMKFDRIESSRTHEKLSYDPCSLWSSVVRGGSIVLNHPELM